MKQMLVLRKDLKMRKGKMIAQGAHAAMKATLENMDHPYVKEWLSGPFKKVAVYVESEEELLEIFKQAEGLPRSLITDAGETEFHNVPTKTAVAVGPAPEAEVDKITGDLKLL